jgi:hypothetical protein
MAQKQNRLFRRENYRKKVTNLKTVLGSSLSEDIGFRDDDNNNNKFL